MNPDHTIQDSASLLGGISEISQLVNQPARLPSSHPTSPPLPSPSPTSRLRHIRPCELFSLLPATALARDVLYHIPELPGRESLTIFSLETLILIAAARIAKVSTILEIGTSWGYNAFHLARNLPDVLVTTVDVESKPYYVWDGPSLRQTNPVACFELARSSRDVPRLYLHRRRSPVRFSQAGFRLCLPQRAEADRMA